MRKSLSTLLVVFFGAVIIIGAFSNANANTIQLKFATWLPPTGTTGKAVQEFCDKVEKDSNGELKIRFYGGGALIKPREFFDACVGGVADITFASHSEERRFLLSTVCYLPLLGFSNGDVAQRVINELPQKHEAVLAEYEGTQLLGIAHLPPNILHLNKKK